MNDFGGFTRETNQGLLSRLRGAFKAMFGGIVLLIVAFGLHFWNEGRTQRRDALLADGRASVQSIDAATASSGEGRLVHISGDAVADKPVVDAEFGVSLPALALRRRVEMYQWVEKKEKRTEKQSGGSERTVTEYRYEKRWEDEAIDSSRFERRSGHDNPGRLPYRDADWRANDVQVGAFALAPEVVNEIDGWERVDVKNVALPPNLAASFRADGDWFTTSQQSGSPAIGDVRVRFDSIPAGMISIVAGQNAMTLVPHRVRDSELLIVERGAHGANAMFDRASESNSRTGWALRFAGLVIAWVGFGVLLRPLVVLADVVPLLGRLAGFGTAVVSGILAALFSVVGIGTGWLWSRPWLLGLMLLGVVGFVMFLAWKARQKTIGPPAPPAAMPPPPPPAHGA